MRPATAAVFAVGAVFVASYAARTAADREAARSAELDTGAGAGATAVDLVNPWGFIERTVDMYQTQEAARAPNVPAFLAMIAKAEGTDRAADPYRVCYGYAHTIVDLRDHPAVTGEWKGRALPDSYCRGAGLKPGCVSTAAGRYQLIKPTWLDCKRQLGLEDFTAYSQDQAALLLIRRRNALDLIESGRIAEAIERCRSVWASLPGAGYAQPERKLAQLLDAFTDAGGQLA